MKSKAMLAALTVPVVILSTSVFLSRGIPFVGTRNHYSVAIFSLDDPYWISMDKMPNKSTLSTRSLPLAQQSRIVADPFLYFEEENRYVFVEVLEGKSNRGEIAVAKQSESGNWLFEGIVLSESFHLSYPQVFSVDDEIYMVPESNEDRSVRLYEAVEFPMKWKLKKKLLEGKNFVDPTLVHFRGKWWMFVGIKGNRELEIYYSETILGPWIAHPKNPVISNNANTARPGGRISVWPGGKLVRASQKSLPHYAAGLNLFEITQLSEAEYSEMPFKANPVLFGDGEGWNADGMHHLDLTQKDGRWWFAVDGLQYKTSFDWRY